ncbi:hypothetical protein [Rhizobium bangladeshense]|uniref:hypothetical protein n=1 Tax=Rhizobium bangladeshense TaxID=1138189 RepID=UPI001A984170|nr:hypothetical protein [Rhizobium bangladeshense]MBX4865801.1 hypothetical protein [Rhizobium bangladeshense]MBX4932620.1 hypothetical protein [Rhizobium bangladeshense]MBY3579916.1 hypothetical protein [Rhizobium bangladeshense]QSY89102.1 hypothetical protein J2J98_02795 [Rhizobium bangladeshense]
MGLDRKLIQAVFLCAALAMPVFAHSAEGAADEALLSHVSTEVIPEMQREYMQTAVGKFVHAIDIAALRARVMREQTLEQWYIEGIYNAVPTKLTAEQLERWAESPSLPYYLEATDIPDCVHGRVLLPTCR